MTDNAPAIALAAFLLIAFGATVVTGLGRLLRFIEVNLVALTMKSGKRYTGRRWRLVRRYVLDRDNHRCRRCKTSSAPVYHVHHRKPVSQGGSHFTPNLDTVCPPCHQIIHGYEF